MGRRQRARTAALAVVTASACLVLSGCGLSEEELPPPAEAGGSPAAPSPTQTEPEEVRGTAGQTKIANGLIFRRGDGREIDFPVETRVWCGPWESDVPTESLHVLVGAVGDETKPAWQLSAVLDDVRYGQTVSFPNPFGADEPEGVSLFVFDPPNEFETTTEASSGSVHFEWAACGRDDGEGRVEFTIDAVVGKEFGEAQPVWVQGTFVGPVTAAP